MTVIIGRSDFCNDLAEAARRRGRPIVTWVVPEHHAVPFSLPDVLSYGEVVLDDRLLESFRGNLRGLIGTGATVRVGHRHHPPAEVFDEPLGRVDRAFKRTVDLVLGALGLILAVPILLVAIIAIKLDSPGAVLFVRDRVGLGSRAFPLFKLRTMTAEHDDTLDFAYLRSMVLCSASLENGIFKPGDNDRITRVGRVLRRYSIDELPQLVNVLRGDMSLVGPRPSLLSEADVYDDLSMRRLRVKPGLTGLSQVSGRSSLRFDEIVALDVAYFESWTPWLELKILAKTVRVIFFARGAG